MKPHIRYSLVSLLFVLPLQAQEEPTRAIQPQPAVTVSGEAGSTYVIESKNGVDDDFWLMRGVVELTSTQAQWFDSVPAKGPRRIYRAVKVTKPEEVQPLENMVWIPAGRFTMGSPSNEVGRYSVEDSLTKVTITRPFWLGKYEVTQREWEELMDTNPSYWKDPDLPVETVTWFEAIEFCEKLTEREEAAGRLPDGYEYSLPTEAQWEYACRAGTSTRFYYGDDPGYTQLGKYAWYRDNSLRTHPVGLKLPNAWGLHDMYGNVWEWCMDWYSSSYPGGSVNDPKGATRARGRVFRGGSWSYNAVSCRSAYRSRSNPTIRINSIGFRVVLAPVQ